MELTAEVRTAVGRSAAKEWRKKGFVIGEVYGNGFDNVHVAVPAKEFAKAYKAAGETTVVTLNAAGAKVSVLIQDVVRDSFSGVVEHADFRQVRMDQKITAYVPVEFVGESPAVKAGAVLVKAVSDLEVEALPADIDLHFDLYPYDTSMLALYTFLPAWAKSGGVTNPAFKTFSIISQPAPKISTLGFELFIFTCARKVQPVHCTSYSG